MTDRVPGASRRGSRLRASAARALARPIAVVGCVLAVLAACSQASSPAPVRIVDPGDRQPAAVAPSSPRLAEALPVPPLPGHKPAAADSRAAVVAPPTAAEPSAPEPSAPKPQPPLLAEIEAALMAPAVGQAPPERPPEAAVGYVTVLPGDTLYALSRRYEVAVKDLIALNGLEAPFHVIVGQDIRLPSQRYHTVEAGDSLGEVALLYDTPAEALIALNALEPPYPLFVGQRLAIPDEASAPSRADSSSTAGAPRVAEAAVPRSASLPERGELRFVWPVEGPVLSGFGPKPDGLRNDGINIAADPGTAVRAAEDGVVAYAGRELAAYGNLVLIRHAEGWVTAYAHNADISVARGQTVARGDTIGSVGATGSVASPQSHFEMRRDGKAVDPLAHLTRL